MSNPPPRKEKDKVRRRRSSVPHMDNDSSSSGEEDDRKSPFSPLRRSHASNMFSSFTHGDSKKKLVSPQKTQDQGNCWTVQTLLGIVFLIILVVYLLQYFDATNRENRDRNPFFNS
jgi:hypothetical protein